METLEVYAPIALRLGMNSLRMELEELGFAHLHPVRHRILSAKLKRTTGNSKRAVSKIRNALKRRMKEERIQGEVLGREKHLYSIYRKMRDQSRSFDNVYDVYGFRIIVDDVDTCYRLIGTAHNLYKPVPGKFKDYIAIPKANGYQSLHTVLYGPAGVPVEIQIRTREMNNISESGIAAHWLYKTPGTGGHSAEHQRARQWLRGIMEIQKTTGNPEEFLEHVKVDLFPESIYVFTPQGEIMELPRGATVVDFAYAIHTGIGHKCVSAQVDQRSVPLATALRSGQKVEVMTAPDARPKPAWLNFVVTARARGNIRHFLKNLREDEALHLGKNMLNRELKNHYNTRLGRVSDEQIRGFLEGKGLADKKELFRDIGLGNRLAPFVAKELMSDVRPELSREDQETTPLLIRGTEGMVVRFPKCCYPIPGDLIYGILTAGHGIVIHNRSCPNLIKGEKQSDRYVQVEWEQEIGQKFPARLSILASNQLGVLATVATSLADAGANIENVEMKDRDDRCVTLTFVIQVRDSVHLGQVMRRAQGLKAVSDIKRS